MDMNLNTSHQEFLLNTVHSHLSTWGTASGVLQGLSLTLGPHTAPVMQIPDIRYQNNNPNITSLFGLSALVTNEDVGKNMNFESEGDFQNKQQFPSVPFYGMMNIASSVSSSKYLKAAQLLLDEVINVKKAIKSKNYKKGGDGEPETASSDPSAMAASSFSPITAASSRIELSASEKQELHSRLTQLLALLDEVDRRYTQYYHQIQMIISSFDSNAGSGVGKSYTSLALQTISRHFRSLRDAINRQIHVARRSLGEEDTSLSDKVIGISRFRYVQRSIRQQRALQQVGITQQQGWRPQRGLPEGSVSVLRAWLFEHFLHPYPKDSDKIMLARKTGLTRCQVSNWFINARVRLWKPMIEEMYREELVDADMDSNSSSETSQKPGKSSTYLTADKSENPEASAALIGTNTNPIGAREITLEIHENTAAESNSGGSGTAECRNINNRISLTLGLQHQDEIDPTSIVDSSRHGLLHLRENNVYDSAASAKATESDSMDSGNPAFQR